MNIAVRFHQWYKGLCQRNVSSIDFQSRYYKDGVISKLFNQEMAYRINITIMLRSYGLIVWLTLVHNFIKIGSLLRMYCSHTNTCLRVNSVRNICGGSTIDIQIENIIPVVMWTIVSSEFSNSHAKSKAYSQFCTMSIFNLLSFLAWSLTGAFEVRLKSTDCVPNLELRFLYIRVIGGQDASSNTSTKHNLQRCDINIQTQT